MRRAGQAAQLVHGRLGFGVERLDLRQQPALRERKLPLRLSTAQFGLLDAALRGSPVPNRNVQRSRRRRSEIRDSTRPIHGKLRRIDSRPVIHTERWQITRTRAGYIKSCRARAFERRANVRIIAGCLLLHFPERRQRRWGVQVFGHFEVVVEVRKNEDSQIEPGVATGSAALTDTAKQAAAFSAAG